MTDPNLHHHGGGDYEREDFGPKAIFTFLAGLAVFALLVGLVVMAMFRALDAYAIRQMKTASPLVAAKPEDYTRRMQEKNIMQFPAPRLDGGEKPFDVNHQRASEAKILSIAQPEWANQATGDVRISIDRAMEIVAKPGALPARVEGSAVPMSMPKQATDAKAAKVKKISGCHVRWA